MSVDIWLSNRGHWVEINTGDETNGKDKVEVTRTFIMYVAGGWMMLIKAVAIDEVEGDEVEGDGDFTENSFPHTSVCFIPDALHENLWDVYNGYPQRIGLKDNV